MTTIIISIVIDYLVVVSWINQSSRMKTNSPVWGTNIRIPSQSLPDASCPPCLVGANSTDMLSIDPSTLEAQSILSAKILYPAAHVEKGLVFWVDRQQNTIERANIDGSNRTTLIDTSPHSARCLAVDWIADRLYYCTVLDNIMATDLDGNNNETFMKDTWATNVAVEPLAGYVRRTASFPGPPGWGRKRLACGSGTDCESHIEAIKTEKNIEKILLPVSKFKFVPGTYPSISPLELALSQPQLKQ